jgi:NAD(P)-dependent dehydrogenase (short-subunit alcohol dehydrogenase family)
VALFTDKVVIITGASEGIGRALSLALAPQRPKIVLAARNAERLGSLCREVEALGAKGLVAPTDLTEEGECRGLIEQAVAEWGGIDLLVNNAGGTMWTMLEEIEDTSIFERLMRLNYLGSALCTYYALPHLKRSRGRIVGVSSVAGLTGVPTRTAYAASKHAMFGFFDSLRVELMGTGVSVTMVAPDFVLSEIHKRALGGDGQPLGRSPLQQGRIMTAEECAQRMVPAIERRERMLLLSPRSKAGYFLKFLAPGLVDRIAAKAIRDKR